jgi:lysyl-tRNA synthetase class 2
MDSPLRKKLARQARFTAAVRAFFDAQGYVEVETPSLAPFLIPEPAIEVFRTDLLGRDGVARPLWLIPSPELWMKRLLAEGSGNIYQVSRSFRNGDVDSPHHNPEFRLLEWYTLGAGYRESIEVTERFFQGLMEHAAPGTRRRLSPPFRRLTMAEAFERYAGIELEKCQEVGSLAREAARIGVSLSRDLTWEEAFHIIFLTAVEPSLPRTKPLILLDYPRQVPTTARRLIGTPWSQRWELFVDGVEIANAYTEETDPDLLGALIAHEEERKKGCRVPHETDRGLARIFSPGFPECSGVALGLDRLQMVFHGEKSLEGVILFPVSAILRGHSDTHA